MMTTTNFWWLALNVAIAGATTGLVVSLIAPVAQKPALVGYACQIGNGELRTLYAEMEDDFPICAAIVPNE